MPFAPPDAPGDRAPVTMARGGERLLSTLPNDRLSQSMPGVQDFPGLGYGLGVDITLDPAQAQMLGSKREYGWGGQTATLGFIGPSEDLTVLFMAQRIPNDHSPPVPPLWRELPSLVCQALI